MTSEMTEEVEDFVNVDKFYGLESILQEKIAQAEQVGNELASRLDNLNEKLREELGSDLDSMAITETLNASIEKLKAENDKMMTRIEMLEKEQSYQEEINADYQMKVNSLKLDYEEAESHLSKTQSKVDLKLDTIDAQIMSLAREQRELFCLMMLAKNNTLDHYRLLENVNYIERKELRDLIEKRFFPDTKAEKARQIERQRFKNDQMVDFNINNVILALEKIQEQYNDL